MSNNVPLAVSPAVKTPGLYLSVNLLAGTSSPGTARLRALIIAPKSSAGSITPNTQLMQAVSGAEQVKTLLGPGTPGHLTAVALFAAHGLASVDVAAPTASAGASAAGSITFAGVVTSAMTIRFTVKGVVIDVAWLVGVTPAQFCTLAAAELSANSDYLPVAAAVDGVTPEKLNLTAKIAGPWGNDVQYYADVVEGAGGTATAAAAALSGGTTEPSFATVLSLVSGREYDFILGCVSNADAESSSSTSNPGRIKTHIDAYSSGASAKLQQAVIGLTSAAEATAKAGAIGRNHGPTQYVYCLNGQSLGCEFAGWEVGSRLKAEEIDPAVNRIGEAVGDGLYGARDPVGDKPTDVEVEDALNNGLSILNYDAQNTLFITRPITAHSQDSAGNPDSRLLDVSGVSGTYAFAKDLRISLPQEFKGAKIIRDLVPGDELPPAGVIEERDVKAFVVSKARTWVRRGVLRRDKLDDAIAAGTLIVKVDDTDETQVDIVIPEGIVKPLAKFSTVIQRVA